MKIYMFGKVTNIGIGNDFDCDNRIGVNQSDIVQMIYMRDNCNLHGTNNLQANVNQLLYELFLLLLVYTKYQVKSAKSKNSKIHSYIYSDHLLINHPMALFQLIQDLGYENKE